MKRVRGRPTKEFEWIIYPPNYNANTDSYYRAKTLPEAKKIAEKLGKGAELHKHVHIKRKDGSGLITTQDMLIFRGNHDRRA